MNVLTYDDADSWDEASESDSTTPSTLESIIATFCNISECSTDQVIDVVQNVFNIPIDNEAMKISLAKAKKLYDSESPSSGMVEKDLQILMTQYEMR